LPDTSTTLHGLRIENNTEALENVTESSKHLAYKDRLKLVRSQHHITDIGLLEAT